MLIGDRQAPMHDSKVKQVMRLTLILFPILLVSQAPQVLFATRAQQIESNATYRLTNDGTGPGKSLGVSGANHALIMADTGDGQEQHWKLISLGNGKYR